MNALILTVGDEILIGQTLDTNSAWLGQQLHLIGIRVIRRITVPDELEAIVSALHEASLHAPLVIMTGGLGPTKDDITKKAIAAFLQVSMNFHEETWSRIQRIFSRMNRAVTNGHREQCFMPEGAQILHNRMGTAPGMWFEHPGGILLSLPGVPYEMKAIMESEALPRFRQLPGLIPILHHTVLTAGLGESEIAQRLEAFEDRLPPHIRLAYLPALGQVKLRLSAYGGQAEALRSDMELFISQLKNLMTPWVFSEGEDTLEATLGRLLNEHHLQMVTAESCTGGFLAHRVTSVPGSSQWYRGSIIAYDNQIKMDQLQVSADILSQFGAVSEQTVLAMLQGCLHQLNGNVGIATSGIAGPDGGTPEKPVGTIWLAVGDSQHPKAIKLQLGKDRLKNIEMTTIHALQQLRLWIIEHRSR